MTTRFNFRSGWLSDNGAAAGERLRHAFCIPLSGAKLEEAFMFIIKTTIVAALLAVAAVLVLATLIRATETVMAPPPSVVSEATR